MNETMVSVPYEQYKKMESDLGEKDRKIRELYSELEAHPKKDIEHRINLEASELFNKICEKYGWKFNVYEDGWNDGDGYIYIDCKGGVKININHKFPVTDEYKLSHERSKNKENKSE